MNASRVLLSSLAALSMTIVAGNAYSKTGPSAARKLALAGAQAADATDNCITRAGKKGKWRLDDVGKWIRCRPKPVGPDIPGRSRFLPFLGAGAAAAGGLTAAVVSASDTQPVSP